MSRTVTNKVGWVSTVYDILGILSIICAVAMLVMAVIQTQRALGFAAATIWLVISGVIFFATSAIIRTFGDIEVNTRENVQNQKLMCEQLVEMNKNMAAIVERMAETKNGIDELDRHLCAGINWFGENLPKMLNK